MFKVSVAIVDASTQTLAKAAHRLRTPPPYENLNTFKSA